MEFLSPELPHFATINMGVNCFLLRYMDKFSGLILNSIESQPQNAELARL